MKQKNRLPFLLRGPVAAISLLLLGIIAMIGSLAIPPVLAGTAPCDDPYNPTINPADFKDQSGKPIKIDNPYFPLKPGTTFTYRGKSEGEPEQGVVKVTKDTKVIQGVRTVVIRDEVKVGGKTVEIAFDWHAQDKKGNVWYFGEFTTDYDPDTGKVLNHDGSWEAGKNNAKAGIIMKAQPKVGDVYRQEFAPDVAEDAARVLHLNKRVSVPYGSFRQVLQTRDFTCLDEDVLENKYYAKGVGLIKAVVFRDGKERPNEELLELVSVKGSGDSGDEDNEDDDDDDNKDDGDRDD